MHNFIGFATLFGHREGLRLIIKISGRILDILEAVEMLLGQMKFVSGGFKSFLHIPDIFA